MEPLSFLVGASLVGVNVHALAALVAGLRSRDPVAVAKLSRRCVLSAGGFALLTATVLGASLRHELPGEDDPASRATRLAMGLSVGMNIAAFALVGCVLPLAAAAVLAAYRKRLTRA